MTWTGQTFTVSQILTAAQMNNMQADMTALANGDAGAPSIQTAAYGTGTVDQAAIGASAVGQSEVKKSYQTVSAAGTTNTFVFSGGVYGMSSQLTTNVSTTLCSLYMGAGPSVSASSSWSLIDNTGTTSADLYYFTASPPYDMGDGEVPLFIYFRMDKSGNIKALSVSTEAPWHYNGPTNIVPSKYEKKNGILVPYVRRKDMSNFKRTYFRSVEMGGKYIEEYIEAFINAEDIDVELTQDIKNADMNILPSALLCTPEDETLGMLDPVSDISWKILAMTSHKDFSAVEFIAKHCTIHNEVVNRKGPDGIKIFKFTEKR